MIKVYLDGSDITANLNAQYPLPENPGGILPDATAGRWYDLLKVINDVPALRRSYFDSAGVHQMKIVDDSGRAFQVKLLLRSKYSARNH